MPNDTMNSLQQHKRKPNHPISFAGRKDRGVSSLIGIALFIIIFTMAIVYVFAWTQNVSNYADVIKTEIDYEQQHAAEMLQVTTIVNPSGQNTIILTNPTSHLIVVREVWGSNHLRVWNGSLSIPSFGDAILSLPSSDINFKVITLMGNIFYSTPRSAQAILPSINQTGHWDVLFWKGSTIGTPIVIGNSIWYELSFSRVYGPSLSWGGQLLSQTFGFIATTIIKPLNSTNDAGISVGLFSHEESACYVNITIIKVGSSDIQSYDFTGSDYRSIIMDPDSMYYIQVLYTNNALTDIPQNGTICVPQGGIVTPTPQNGTMICYPQDVTATYPPQTVTVTIVGADFA